MLNLFLTVVVVIMLIPSSTAFAPVSINSRKSRFHGSIEENSVKRNMLLAPQILFIGSCAVAVAAYAYTNLDAIMEGQRQNLERTVTEQKSGLKSVQEKQAADLRRVQNEQAANIERAKQSARDAQNRR